MAAGLWGCIAVFTFVVPATPARMDRATADLIPGVPFWEALVASGPGAAIAPGTLALLLAIFGGGAFLLYGTALHLVWNRSASIGNVAVLASISAFYFGTAVLALPTQNTDVFNYMVQGRVSSAHGENPYLTAPRAFPDDPILPYAGAQYTTEPNDYLPAWGVFNSTVARLAGDDPVRGLITYRLAFMGLSLGCLLLIVGILGTVSPNHVRAGIVTFAWNPIVILEGQSRVDTLMAFLTLSAVLLIVHRRLAAGAAALTLSVLTKWITLPLLFCFVAGRFWRRQWTTILWMAMAAAVAAAAVYAPFLEDPAILGLHLEMLMRGGSSAPDGLRWVLGAGLVALAVWFGRYQDEDRGIALWSWAILLLYFTAFLTKIGFSWYLIVPAALVALVRDVRIVIPFLMLGLAAFAFQMRDGSFNSGYDLVDLLPFDRFWVFLALSAVGTAAVAAVVVRRLRTD